MDAENINIKKKTFEREIIVLYCWIAVTRKTPLCC